jgi:hypothetical protein
MRPYIVRAVALLAVATLASLAACGSSEAGAARLKKAKVGMTRAELLAVVGEGPLSATGNDSVRLVQGFRRSMYLTNAKMYEVIYMRDEPGNVRELVLQKQETPVVLADDKVLGWGWKYYVGAMKEFGLPSPIIHVDSTAAKAQEQADKDRIKREQDARQAEKDRAQRQQLNVQPKTPPATPPVPPVKKP